MSDASTIRRHVVPTSKTGEVLRWARVQDERLFLAHPDRAHQGQGGALLAPRPEQPMLRVDAPNGLVDVDAGATLPLLARLCRAQGLVLPLARPLPHLSLQAAVALAPIVLDALVHSLDAVTLDGLRFSTPMAPRAAAGPDLAGAVAARPPLAVLLRARLRVFSSAHAACEREVFPSTAAAAARVVALLEEGRALSVDAVGATVLALVGTGSPRREPPVEPASAPFAHQGRPRFSSGRSLVPGDVEAVAHALARGERVIAAPLMGRVGALSTDKPSILLGDEAAAAAALAGALGKRPGRAHRESPRG